MRKGSKMLKEKLITLSLRLPESIISAIDQEIARRLREAPGIILHRSDIGRDCIIRQLRIMAGKDTVSLGRGPHKGKQRSHGEALYETGEGPVKDHLPLAKDLTLTPEDLARIPQDPGEDYPAPLEDLEDA